MLRGISQWCFPPDWQLQRCADVAAQAGIEAWEFGFGDGGPVGMQGTPETASAAREVVEKAGLQVCSAIGGGPMWAAPVTSPSQDVRQQARQATLKLLDQAAAMQLSTATIMPGLVQNIFNLDLPVIPYDTAMENLRSFLQEMVAEARQRNLRLLIENVWNKFLYSPLELAAVIDETDSEWLGIHFDVGNTQMYGVPEDYARILGSRIKQVHVKDWKSVPGDLPGFCSLLQGEVNWPAVTATLKQIGYDGALVAEIPAHKHYPEVHIHHIALGLRAIIDGGLQER